MLLYLDSKKDGTETQKHFTWARVIFDHLEDLLKP